MVLLALVLMPFAWACGGDDEDTIDVGNGDVTVGEGLPDGWPDDFPVYDGADLQGGARGDVDGTEGLIATWETDDDVGDVVDFYTDELSDGPWKSLSTSSSADGSLIAFENTGDDRGGSVLIGESDGKTTIFVSIGEGFESDGDEPDGSDGDGSGNGDSDDGDSGDGDSGNGDSGETPSEDDLPDAVDLPETYPADRVPLPDGARVTQAVSSTASGVGSHVIQFYHEDSVDEIGAYFESELEGNGFSQTLRTESEGTVLLTYSEGDDPSTSMVVIITITASDVSGFTETAVQVSDPE
jgi:hypothetical protein